MPWNLRDRFSQDSTSTTHNSDNSRETGWSGSRREASNAKSRKSLFHFKAEKVNKFEYCNNLWKQNIFHNPVLRKLKAWPCSEGPGTSPISQPIFFRNPTSQCSNPIPTSRIWKKSQCYTYHLFSLRIRKITASKYDPTKTQKFTRIYKDVLEITGSFQTVIKLSSSEFIAISPCHFTFLPFLPAGNLPSDL